MKRVVSTLLCLAMVACLFAGCSQKQSDSSASSSKTGTVSGEPQYIDKNAQSLTGTVRFYTAFAGANGTDAMIKDFNSYYPNVKVSATVYKNTDDGNVSLDTAMMAGQVDAILSFGVANTAKRWNNNMLLDITDRLAKDNLDLVKEWGTKTYTKNGKAFVFPSGGLSIYVAINMTAWKAAGLGALPTEWTWDDYLKDCKAMTHNGVYGGSDFNQVDYWTYSVRQSKGSNVFYKKDGKSDFDNKLFSTVLQREVTAEKDGIWYPKKNYIANSTTSRDLFLNGTNASSVESILTRYIKTTKHDFTIGYAPYPVNKKGETNYMAGSIPNSFVGVAANCSSKDASYAFAKFAATYGNKYMYAAGHASRWTGVKSADILNVVFGSADEAKKWIDVDSFTNCVLAKGKNTYSENQITAYTEIQSLVSKYTQYVLTGEISVAQAMKELKNLSDDAIEDAK